MRRILVENARRKRSVKHGGGHKRIKDFEVATLPGISNVVPEDLISLDEALANPTRSAWRLAKLSGEDQLLSDLVKLHCFTGLPLIQVAEILGIPHRTTERRWAFARAWLNKEILGD